MLLTTFEPVPEALFTWLSHQGILTQHLKASAHSVEMKVLSHQWALVNWWERYVLGLAPRSLLLRRDILMLGDDKPCWFARTLIPRATYEQDPAFFDRLHQEPLFRLIFNETRVVRQLIHGYGIDHQNLEHGWVQSVFGSLPDSLWMRQSSFVFEGKGAFYLTEIFFR